VEARLVQAQINLEELRVSQEALDKIVQVSSEIRDLSVTTIMPLLKMVQE
jgi:hypothetical protein